MTKFVLSISILLLVLTLPTDAWRRRRRRSPPPPPPPDTTPPVLYGCPLSLGNRYTTTTTAVVTWSEPTCSDSRSACTVSRTSGAAPGSSFSEGYKSISYRAVDTSGNSATCSVTFTVVVIRCSTLSAPSHGSVSCNNGRNVGSVCQVSCTTGYALSGSSSRTCQASGNSASWSGTAASCSRITCSPAVANPSNGHVACTDSAFYGSVCSYSCNSGYTKTSGSAQRTCSSSGAWSGTAATCADITPPVFSSCPSSQTIYAPNLQTSATATWQVPVATDSTGQTITPVQTGGLLSGSDFPEGVNLVTYTAQDAVGNTATDCAFSILVQVIRCSAISGDPNLLVSCPQGSLRGSVCTFTCSVGYGLNGASSTTCLMAGTTGSWSNPTPSCNILQCPTVSLSNGQIVGTCSRNYGSTCRFGCNVGYVINNDELTCTAQPGSSSAHWEGEPPFCSIINCTKPTLSTGLDITPSTSCPTSTEVPYGSSCQFTCELGFYIQGDSVLSCESDGTWDRPPPTCHVVHCSSSDIPTPSNGGKTGCPNSAESYGTVCTISCHVGYLPDTPVYRACGDDGSGTGVWNGGPVTCTIVMCPGLASPTNGFIAACTYQGVSQSVGGDQKYSTVCGVGCDLGFTMTGGSAARTCLASGSWDGVLATCVDITPPVLTCPTDQEVTADTGTTTGTVPWGIWEPIMATDAGIHLQSHLVSIDSTDVSNKPSSLAEGGHQLMYGVSDAAGNNNTCTFFLTVRVIRCPGLHVPDFGAILPNGGHVTDCTAGAVFGSTCRYECNSGYQLSTGTQEFSRNCTANSQADLVGYWDGHQPYCQIKNCTVPRVVNGRETDCPSAEVNHGTTCEFECNRGYTTSDGGDRASRLCQADTSWTGHDFSCTEVITCTPHVPLNYGLVDPPACTANSTGVWFDTVCLFSCGDGFILHGPLSKQCRTDGTWSDVTTPYCEDVQNPVFTAGCPITVEADAERETTRATVALVPPHAFDNSGNVTVTRLGSATSIFYEGSTTVTYKAADASGNEARCDVIVTVTVYRCTALSPPVDGAILNCPSDPIYGVSCAFGCDVGHDLIGSENVTCVLTPGLTEHSGMWDMPPPTCRIRTCPALTAQPPAIKAGCSAEPPATETYGAICTFSCPYGYQGVGASRKDCDENGEWTSTNFTCDRTPCPPLQVPRGMTITPLSCTVDPKFGDTCSLYCTRSGFLVQPEDVAMITCSGNSRWTNNIIAAYCKDIEPPVFTSCPNNIHAYADKGLLNTSVYWTARATDNDVIGPTVSCDHAENTTMAMGNHAVSCLASDNSGNDATCQFDIMVEVRRCPSLQPPVFGTLNGSCDNFYGAECHVTCLIGYRLLGSSLVACEFNGTDMFWEWEVEPSCEVIGCAPINIQPMIAVYPDSCVVDKKVIAGTVCTFHCPHGLTLVGDSAAVTCLQSEEWDRELHPGSLLCEDKSPPEVTFCPDTVRSVRTEHWGVEVVFSPPTAQDNLDSNLTVSTDPPGLTSPYNFTLSTGCTYVFKDDMNNTAVCVFDVMIEDKVVPTFTFCPRGQNVTTSQQMTLLQWEEPVVQDILGDDVLVTCNFDGNQAELPWGDHVVVYRATNLNNGLQNECRFVINITPVPCRELHTPTHGALSCDLWMYGRYCTASCQDSYDIPRVSSGPQPAQLYVCGSSGLWSPHAHVADCSETRDPRRSHLPSVLQYYAGDCLLQSTKDDIAQSFIDIIQGTVFRDICDFEDDCTIDNVAVSCGSGSNTAGINSEEAQTTQSSILRRRRRDVVPEIETGLKEIKLGDELKGTDVLTITMNIGMGNTPKRHQTGLELEGKLLSLANQVREQMSSHYRLKGAVMTTGYSEVQCEEGFVADHESLKCVACPTGTFHDNVTSQCNPCFYGYYQDRQGQVVCIKCPKGFSTEEQGSRRPADCKERCPPGYFSADGLQPCISCPRDTFQPMRGQAMCFKCPDMTFTSQRGAASPELCTNRENH